MFVKIGTTFPLLNICAVGLFLELVVAQCGLHLDRMHYRTLLFGAKVKSVSHSVNNVFCTCYAAVKKLLQLDISDTVDCRYQYRS